MDELVAGLIGVGAGALTTGGIQSFFAWRDRHHQARTSARLLFGDAKSARDVLIRSVQEGGWRGRSSFEQPLKMWADHRERLAYALPTQQFHDVAGAFVALDILHAVRTSNAGHPGEGFSDIWAEKSADAVRRLDNARVILARAGLKPHERLLPVGRIRIEEMPFAAQTRESSGVPMTEL